MKVDLSVVCLQDVAKHECEDVKRGAWLEPHQAKLRRKTSEARTDKHRNVTRKLVVEGGWVQKRFCDIGWSDEKKCRGRDKEEGEEAQTVSPSVMEGSRRPDPTRLGRSGSKGEDLKEGLEVAERESHHTL